MFQKVVATLRVGCRLFPRCESGQIAVTFAIVLAPVMVAVGAAVDYSVGNQAKVQLQTALDSSVLAAATNGSATWKTIASNIFSGNLQARGMTVSVPQFDLNDDVYSGSVAGSVQTAFLGIAGIKTIAIQAKAAATPRKLPVCLLGLNAFDGGAFDMNGNPKLNAPGCAVQANTSNSRGMTQEGNPKANAAKFGVNGGHTGDGYSPAPKDGSPTIADPYASIPFPIYDPCDSKPKGTIVNGGTATLSPGTYCGGITIKGPAQVELRPGIYVMVDGPFAVDGSSSVHGVHVMIAFTGTDSTLRLWGNSTLDLTAPISGIYANFQFFQDRNDMKGRGAWVSIGGNGNTDDSAKATWDGIAYFPTQNFWQYGNTVVNVTSPDVAIVAGQIWLQGNTTMNVTHDDKRKSDTQTTTTFGARLLR